MLKHRKGSRRSFTVEVKAGVRRGSPVIPSRADVDTKSRVSWPPLAEPEAPAVARPELRPVEPAAPTPRRILPSLIPPPAPEAEAPEPPGRRGRPRKAPSVAAEPVVKPIAPEPPAPALEPATASPRPKVRLARPGAPLPAGERWRRRLGRWSR